MVPALEKHSLKPPPDKQLKKATPLSANTHAITYQLFFVFFFFAVDRAPTGPSCKWTQTGGNLRVLAFIYWVSRDITCSYQIK